MFEYHVEFNRLAHGLLLYNNNYDDTYFVTHFVAGLKEEIRRVIALHQPKDVDTASALALLQEEELNRSQLKHTNREYPRTNFKNLPKKPQGQEVMQLRQRSIRVMLRTSLLL